jgi:hypothetical protein
MFKFVNLLQHWTKDQWQLWVLLEVEWEENHCRPRIERLVLVYNKANVLGLCNFLQDKATIWANSVDVLRYGIISGL